MFPDQAKYGCVLTDDYDVNKMIGTNDWSMCKIKRMDQATLSETKIGTSQYIHIFLYTSMETELKHLRLGSISPKLSDMYIYIYSARDVCVPKPRTGQSSCIHANSIQPYMGPIPTPDGNQTPAWNQSSMGPMTWHPSNIGCSR